MRLDDLCRQLSGAEKNMTDDVTGTPISGLVTSTKMSEVLDDTMRKKETQFLNNFLGILGMNDTNVPLLDLNVTFEAYQYVMEWYVFVTFCTLGVIMNVSSLYIIARDVIMRKMAGVLLATLLIMETVFLCLVLTFIQLRHTDAIMHHVLEIKGTVSMVMGMFECYTPWILYILATDAYRSVRYFRKTSKLVQLTQSPRHVAYVTLLTSLYHLGFLPHVRYYLLYRFIPGGHWFSFYPCYDPIESHWDFSSTGKQEVDLYFIFYYSLLYVLLHYVIPGLLLGCRDKDVIDVIHAHQNVQVGSDEARNAAMTSVPISVMCNITMIAIIPKVTLLLFQQLEFAFSYIRAADTAFRVINVLANGFILLKSSMYLFVLLIYNPRLRAEVFGTTSCPTTTRGSKECKRSVSWAEPPSTVEIVDL